MLYQQLLPTDAPTREQAEFQQWRLNTPSVEQVAFTTAVAEYLNAQRKSNPATAVYEEASFPKGQSKRCNMQKREVAPDTGFKILLAMLHALGSRWGA